MGIVAAFFVGIVVGVGVIIIAAVFQSSRRFHAVLRWVTNMAVNDFVTYVQLPPVETIWKSTAPLKVDAWLPPEREREQQEAKNEAVEAKNSL